MTRWIQKHTLTVFFVLTYAISWSFMIPVAASAQGLLGQPVAYGIYYLASFGPTLSAIILTAIVDRRAGLQGLLSGLLKWRVGLRYLAFSTLAPVVFFLIAVAAGRIFTGVWPDLSLLGAMDYLPYLGIPGALGLWFLTYGFGEEVGWRGYALPRLQNGRDARSAALILGLLWALWHLPAFFFRDTYTAMGLLFFPVFLVSVAFASIILTWLYNSTRGSILMVILFHVLFDWLSVSEAGGQYVAIIMSAAAILWAVWVMRVYGPENLSPVRKEVAG